jgi:hypothetical protein
MGLTRGSCSWSLCTLGLMDNKVTMKGRIVGSVDQGWLCYGVVVGGILVSLLSGH